MIKPFVCIKVDQLRGFHLDPAGSCRCITVTVMILYQTFIVLCSFLTFWGNQCIRRYPPFSYGSSLLKFSLLSIYHSSIGM